MKQFYTLILFLLFSFGTFVSVCFAQTQTFNYTGGMQTFVVPAGVTQMIVDARGAQGGIHTTYGNGGMGGRTQATLSVVAGQTLNIFVGGNTTTITGGYNGGGNAVNTTYARGGGGATDVRIGGTALTDRVIVAAGGGGAGTNCYSYQNHGGAGGGVNGDLGWQCNAQTTYVGFGGTQTGGGTFGNNQGQGCGTAGTLGQGGTGACTYGGGGGGGYYGGGGGGYGGGGGGSSYVTSVGSSAISYATGFQTGNGQIILSWVVVACSGMPLSGTATVNSQNSFSICSGGLFTLNSSGASSGGAIQYQWQTGPTSTGPWSNISGGTSLSYSTSSTITSWYRLEVTCTTSGQQNYSNSIQVTISPLASPTSNGTTISCGSSTTLTASGSTGSYAWYNASTGGTLLSTSANYTTPPLGSTTTYWVEATNGTLSGSQTYNYTGSIQSFTVPVGITSLTIDARGARGGTSGSNLGGLGARIMGTVAVTPGQVLQILVGEQGQPGTQGGGGGGSFVVAAGNTPLVIAGGGGGSYYTTYSFSSGNMNGAIGNAGINGIQGDISVIAGLGGTGGNGGGTSTTYTADGAGGGGMLTNGADGVPATGGRAFVNGGAGGLGGSAGGRGGFGGGGGGDWSSWTGGGGGGGYSGGGGGVYYGCGGGGGSFNSGINQTNTPGFQTGNGQVILTWSGTSCSSARIPVVVTIPGPASPTASGATVNCGGSTTLTASGSTGNYAWYSASTGGTLLGSSASYSTPALTASTTYWVEATSGSISGNQTFNFTGNVQTFTVPAGVTQLTVDARGASGGNISGYGNAGLGGRTQAILTVVPGQNLNFYVGGTTTTITGGYNGGGPSVNSTYTRGGGGASDIRIGGNALTDRVLVAAGGGGSGYNCGTNNHGGNGGGLIGLDGWQCGTQTTYVGLGGSQSAGGAFGNNQGQGCGTAGTLGSGGTGACTYGGGGGGGYYGGGGGGYGGGGGGSSYVTITGSSAITHTAGFQSGNGQILLSWTGSSCSSSRIPVVVSVNGPATPLANGVAICNPASVTLTAGGSTGSYAWYTVSTGGTSVSTSASYTTPVLGVTTTYWVEATSGLTNATYTFTSANATADVGPTQSQINNAYLSTNLNGLVTSNLGIQSFTITATGAYTIDSRGAQGAGTNGGRGARMQGTFNLNTGDVLQILVGQRGTLNDNGAAGGGGSYVVRSGTPLIIAGGGGGNNGTLNAACDGSSTTSGAVGFGSSGTGAGGTGGNQGLSCSRGQGGAGWNQDGPVFSQATTDTPARRFLNGGRGGFHNSSPGGLGGFGGGGGTWNTGFRGSAGGGGYSGGGSGYVSTNNTLHYGGGAGSYNTGATQTNTSGFQTGDGSVIISVASPSCSSTRIPVVVTVGTSSAPSVLINANPNTSICQGTSVTFNATPTNGGTTPSYQWYVNGNPVGSNSTTYTSTALNNNDQVRVVINAVGPCINPNTASSNTITMVVQSPVVVNTITASQSICGNVTPAPFAGSNPGVGVYNYQWEASSNNSTWSTINGETQQNYSSGSLGANTYFRRLVSAGTCTPSTSNSISVMIQSVVLPTVSISANPGTTICTGTSVTFTATPTNGGTTPVYQWNINGNPVGSNSSVYTTNGLLNGNIVQVTLTSNAVCATPSSVTSNSLTIQVNPIPPTPLIVTNSPLCQGSSLSLTTSPTAFATYSWQGPSGYTSSNLINTIPNVNSSRAGTYSLIVTVANCPSPVGTAVVVITDSIGTQSISPSQTICSGSTANILSGANPTGGNGIYTYIWESSLNNAGWSLIVGGTNQSYTPGILTTTTYYRRIVGSGFCPGNSSQSIAVTVEQPLGNNSLQPAQTLCAGNVPAQITGTLPSGGTGIYSYSWASSTNNSSWTTLTGLITQDFSPGVLNSSTYYRRVVSGGLCLASTSAGLLISVDPLIGNSTIMNDQTICSGTSPQPLSGSLPNGGNGVYAYQWESSPDQASWSAISGGTAQNYTEGILTTTAYYRRSIVSGACNSMSGNVRIRVEQGIIGNTLTPNQTLCSGSMSQIITGSSPAGGNGVFTYSWESSSNNSAWSLISGANNQNYNAGVQTNSAYYRRLVSSGVCSGVTSTSVVLVVEPVITNNTITGTQTICALQTSQALTGSVPIGGQGTYTFNWESSPDNISWSSLSTNSQNLPGQSLSLGTYYRRTVSSGVCPPSTSGSLLVQVLAQLLGNTISGNQTICSGSVSSQLIGTQPSGGAGVYAYQWEESLNGSSFSAVPGGLGQNYNPGVLTVSRYYRRVLNSGPCTDLSGSVFIRVDSVIGSNVISSNQTICSGSTPQQLSGTSPSGGSGLYSYQWESSLNNIGWGILSGTTNSIFQPGSLNSSIWYRRVVSSGVCAGNTSSGIQIVVNAIPTATLSGSHTVCTGSGAALSINLTGTAPWTVLWSDGMSTQTINSINSSPYILTVTPSVNTTYSLSSVFAACTGTTSGQATVQVTSVPTATISGANTICTGGSTSLSVNFTGSSPWNLGYQQGSTPVTVNGITNNPYVFSVTPSSTTNYSVTSIFSTCSGLVSGNVSVVVNAIPSAQLSGTQTICIGNNANLTVNLSGGAPWDIVLTDGTNTIPVNGILSSPYTTPVGPLSNRTYTLQSVFATCSGNVSGSASVRVNPVPTATISGNQTVCANYPVNLSFNLSGTGPWNISYTDGISPMSVNGINNPLHVISLSPTANRTYTLTNVFATCNGNVSGSANVGVTNPPFGFMSGNNTICTGDTSVIQIGLSGFSPWNLSWTDGTTATVVTGITSSPYRITVTPGQTRNYSMVNVSSNCPGNVSGRATVVVNPIPNASFTSALIPVCTGGGSQISVNLTGVQPWSFTYTDGVSPVTINNVTSSPYVFNVNPVTPETYTLTNVNATCNGTFGIGSVTVQPETPPTAVLSGSQTVCVLTGAELSVNFTGTGPWNIVYTDGLNNYSVNGLNANPGLFTVNAGGSGSQKTYNLMSVTGACAGVVSGTAVVDVVSKPVGVLSAPAGLCTGIGGQLSVSLSGNGPRDVSYTDGTNTFTENNIVTSPHSWTVTPTGTSVTYQLSNLSGFYCAGNVLSTPLTIPISIQPTATLSGVQTICSGNSAQLSLSMTGQSPWTAIYTDGISNFTIQNLMNDTVISITPNSTITYTLTTIATNGCIGTVTGSELVTVVPSASPSVAGLNQNLCTNAANLSGNLPVTGTGYWNVLQGGGIVADADTNITTVSNLSVGVNILEWAITSGQCVSTSQVTLTVNVPPTTANAGVNQNLCGTSTVLGGNLPVNGTGTWTVLSGTANITNVNDANSPVNNLSLGLTVLEWTIVSGGCTTSSTVTINSALSAPASSAGQDQLTCSPISTLNAMTPVVGTGYWTVVSGSGVVSDSLNPQSQVSGLGLGSNVFVWITVNGGCQATDTMEVQVVEAPNAQFAYTQFGFDIDFNNTSTGGGGSYNWTFGDGQISSNQHPHHTYMQAGEYPVRLIITNICRSDTVFDTVRIGGVKNEGLSDLNNAISIYPNPADGGYIELRITGLSANHLMLRMYNILGSEVLSQAIDTEGRDRYTERIELGTLLSKGTYTIVIESSQGRKVEKLIVR